MKPILLFIVLAGISGAVSAVEPIKSYDMTLELASKLATETLAECKKLDKKGAVAVVDRGGNLVSLLRENNVGPHNTLAAQRKAYTALSTKSSTRQLAQNARSNVEASNLNTVKELLLLSGGVPVKFNNEVIGAVGVAGMGGAEFDEKCAINAISNLLPAQ